MELEEVVLGKIEAIINRRRLYERTFQEIVELVRPTSNNVNRATTPGELKTLRAFDGTAIESCNQLASGLHSYLVNPTERWFTLSIVGAESAEIDEDGLAWLEVVSDIIYNVYGQSQSNFTTSTHEGMLDIAAFGTSCVYQELPSDAPTLCFKAVPLSDTFIEESSEGLIDTVVTTRIWTVRQCRQEFKVLPRALGDKKDHEQVTVVHLVCPRADRDISRFDAKNKKFASYWVCRETKEIIDESGYDTQPYHCGRWMKLASEVYGTGPGRLCMPDIKLLNVMERTLVKAAEKITDPPLQVPDEGFLLPLSTAPGSLIMKEVGAEHIEPLIINGSIPWSVELANAKRDAIRRGFHADWLRMEKENKEMTAFEVADRRNEKLQLIAPMLGRIQREQLDPIIKRTYALLKARRYFPPAPESLQRRTLVIAYVSPAARAQLAQKANEIGRYISEVTPLIQVYPNILDAINFDKLAKKLAEYRSMSRSVLRTDKEIAEMRKGREEMQAAQQLAQTAEPISKAMKNVADAQSKGLNMGQFA